MTAVYDYKAWAEQRAPAAHEVRELSDHEASVRASLIEAAHGEASRGEYDAMRDYLRVANQYGPVTHEEFVPLRDAFLAALPDEQRRAFLAGLQGKLRRRWWGADFSAPRRQAILDQAYDAAVEQGDVAKSKDLLWQAHRLAPLSVGELSLFAPLFGWGDDFGSFSVVDSIKAGYTAAAVAAA